MNKYLFIFLALFGCAKDVKEPEPPVKKTLTITYKGSGNLSTFTINGKQAYSPAQVVTGDKVIIKITTHCPQCIVNYEIIIDGELISKNHYSYGYSTSFTVK